MSLAQPTLDLLLLDEVSKVIKQVSEVLETIQQLTSKFQDLSDKVNEQDSKIDNIMNNLSSGINEKDIELSSSCKIDTKEIEEKIKSIQDNTEIDNKNINMNRTEIENLYKLVHIVQEDNKLNLSKTNELKQILEIINTNHNKIAVNVMDRMNEYIKELQDKNTTYSSILQRNNNQHNNGHNNGHNNSHNYNYTRRRSPMNSQKDSPVNSDNEGWHTVRPKRRTNKSSYNWNN